jgi:hypothetical protein
MNDSDTKEENRKARLLIAAALVYAIPEIPNLVVAAEKAVELDSRIAEVIKRGQ